MRSLWVDATAGIAGDMLLAALLDAGARVPVVQAAVDAVAPGSVRLRLDGVTRRGLRAASLHVDVLVEDPPHRTWRTLRDLLQDADLPPQVRDRTLVVFARLAAAEGRVHGTDPEDVHFHEVGALDSIADVVGTCAALHDLGVEAVTGSAIALGAGTVRGQHGVLPVPVPAVLELVSGWPVSGLPPGTVGEPGELATPTGVALLTALATPAQTMPALLASAVGIGAGTRQTLERPNVVRVVVGEAAADSGDSIAVVLEANVDDLDPRAWPGVLSALLAAGASDAWLTPILMKKGRPAHTLSVLADPGDAVRLRELVLRHTTTFGVRWHEVRKHALARQWVQVAVRGEQVRVKLAQRDGVLLAATPEHDDVAALAERVGVPLYQLLAEASAAALSAGLVPGASLPPG